MHKIFRGLAVGACALWALLTWAAVPEAPAVLQFGEVGMVPVRAIAEIGAATLTEKDGVVTVTRGDKTVVFTVGADTAKAEKELKLPLAPFDFAGTVYVPAQALVTALGGTAVAEGPALTITLPGLPAFAAPVQAVPGTPATFKKANLDLFLIQVDGGRVQQLTYDVRNASSARFTADGAAILTDRNGDIVRRALNAPTGANLTSAYRAQGLLSGVPVPCPDGSFLFMQVSEEENEDAMASPDICRMQADGTGYQKLAKGVQPIMSADGKTIVFTVEDAGKLTMHAVDADGKNDRALGEGLHCALSPDGATLYYVALKETNGRYTALLAGMMLVDQKALELPKDTTVLLDPNTLAVRPDGKQVVFARPNAGLWTMDADGGNVKQLTKEQDSLPTYTPDGKQIIFLRSFHLYRMDTDGGNLTEVAPEMLVQYFTLSPDGTQVLAGGLPERVREAYTHRPTPAPRGITVTAPTTAEVDAAKKAGTRTAVISTSKGDITVELYGKDAPLTVANFVKLAQAKFYDGLTFHRVEPGFVIQGGDPNGDGTGGPGYEIKLEIAPKLRHVEGALAMARSQDPDSAGCQFYITLDKQPFLDDNYAVFGKVTKGMDVVKKIQIGDTIKSVTVK